MDKFSYLPERTLQLRHIRMHKDRTDRVPAPRALLGVADRLGIELIHLVGEGSGP